MVTENRILIAKAGEQDIFLEPSMANRHGLIAGATGTGKTVSLKVLAESFSDLGVPVFLADAKGDLSGMPLPGEETESVRKRLEPMGLEERGFAFQGYPTVFWDVFQEKGLPLRATASEMGPLMLSRILSLNETQSDILTVLFKIADDEELLLVDLKDLKSMINHVNENRSEYTSRYGNMAPQSLGSILRAVIALEAEGGELFFGEPAVDIRDWIAQDASGKGRINILECEKLMQNPTMYATFMLFMLSELYELMPEVGDLPKPKLVFFFDEAHMLFDDAPKALLTKIEQVVKLIRSKGVGIFFITQNPQDIPDGVLSQLSNKIQHALHAYTPAEQKKAKAAAMSYRSNESFDTYETLITLGTGEALISVLGTDGIPTIVEKGAVVPPQSKMGPMTGEEIKAHTKADFLYTKYAEAVDRFTAYEFLERMGMEEAELKRLEEEAKQKAKEEEKAAKEQAKAEEKVAREQARAEEKAAREQARAEEARRKAGEKEQQRQAKQAGRAAASVAGTAGGTVGREVGNALGETIGGKFGKKLGGNLGASIGRGLLSNLFKR